jgi:hypothetical protein
MPLYGTCGNGTVVTLETTDVVVVTLMVAVVVEVALGETNEPMVDWSAEILCSWLVRVAEALK